MRSDRIPLRKGLGVSADITKFVNQIDSEMPKEDIDKLMSNLLLFIRKIGGTVNTALDEILMAANTDIEKMTGTVLTNIDSIRISATNEINLILKDTLKLLNSVSTELLNTVNMASQMVIEEAGKATNVLLDMGQKSIISADMMIQDTIDIIEKGGKSTISKAVEILNNELEKYKLSIEAQISSITENAKIKIDAAKNENDASVYIKYKDTISFSIIGIIIILLVLTTIGTYINSN